MSLFKKKKEPKPRKKVYVTIYHEKDYRSKIEIKKSDQDALIKHLTKGTEEWISVDWLHIQRETLKFFSFCYEED